MHLSKIYNKIKNIALEFGFRIQIVPSNYFGNYPNFILMYHGVHIGGNPYNNRHSSTSDFETQLQFLKHYFNVVSVEDFFEKKFVMHKPNVAITFDDGLQNNYTNAFPLLEKHKVPATIYCTALNTTNHKYIWADYLNVAAKFNGNDIEIDGEKYYFKNQNYYHANTGEDIYHTIKNNKASFDFKLKMYEAFHLKFDIEKTANTHQYWQLMTDEQMREIANSEFVSIGSHGFYHNSLSKIPLNDAVLELKKSKEYLETIINKTVSELAYPDSSYSQNLVHEALKMGFKYQLGVSVFDAENKSILDQYSKNLKSRRGVYNCNSANLQILDAIKDLKIN